MGEAVPGRVTQTGRNTVDQLGYQAEGTNGLGPHSFHAQQALEILGLLFVDDGENPAKPLRMHILCSQMVSLG